MRIALLAEGCYPYVTGGVSTWCDQLVRGLDGHDFEVVAITGGLPGEPLLALPDNVRSLTALPLWGPPAAPRRGAAVPDAALLQAYGALLRAVLDPLAPPEDFTGRLRTLARLAADGDLTRALQSEEALGLLLRVWAELAPGPPLTLRDAIDATDLVEHFLRPVSAPPVRARRLPRGLQRPARAARAGGQVAVRHPAGGVRARRLPARAVPGLRARSSTAGR